MAPSAASARDSASRATRRRLSVRGLRRAVFGTVLLVSLVSSVDARPWSWLGVRIRDLSEQETEEIAGRHGIREGFGVVIVDVLEGTPAAKAGLKSGDIVVAFEERPVIETRLLQRLIAGASIERETRLTVLRPEGRRQVAVRLVTMPRPIAGERVAADFGFILRETETAEETAAGRAASSAPSVTVVIRGSPAERAGLEVGDVLMQINEQTVVTREAARETLADVAVDRPLRLLVKRRERQVPLTVLAP